MYDLIEIALRAIVVYLFIILAIRIFGKRELSQLSVIDLVFILLISNAVQNAMVGPNNSLLGGLIAAFSLFVINSLLQYLAFRSKKINKFLEGDAVMLIYKGKILSDHLKKAFVSEDELEEAVREHGVAQISDVDLAILETDGNISIISNDYKQRTSKKRKSHKIIAKQD